MHKFSNGIIFNCFNETFLHELFKFTIINDDLIE